MTELPRHARLMEEALARAPARDGWLHLPDLPVDYHGPADGPSPFGPAGRDRPVLETLAGIAARLPQAVAYADTAREIRLGALPAVVARLAAAIREAGGEGPIGLLLPGGVGAAVAILGCLAAGRASVLLDAGQAPARNAAFLARAGARLAVGPAGTALPGLPFVPIERAFDDTPVALPPGGALGLDETAFILGTSGSTGEPKLIAYSQRGVLQQVHMLLDGMRAGEGDRCLLLIPPANVTGLVTLLTPLHGCAVDLLPLAELGLRDLRERLRTHPPTIMRAGPTLLRTIAALPDAAAMLAGLRALRVSGEPLLRADIALLSRCLPPDCRIYNRYGATELIGTSWVPRLDDEHDPVRTAAGLPDPEVEVKIVDEAGAPCPPGVAGELWMRGRYAALGEWTADGLVPGRLGHDPSDPSLRVYRTGDLARLAPDGAIVVLGRLDRMVKVNGHRVELAEVETALRGSEEVRQVAVVARQDAKRVALHAFVVAAPGVPPGLEARLRQALRGSLPGYMVPAGIVLLDALPQLPGGKLDERALLASIPLRD